MSDSSSSSSSNSSSSSGTSESLELKEDRCLYEGVRCYIGTKQQEATTTATLSWLQSWKTLLKQNEFTRSMHY